jgi:Icc-related predicted phosphoesterase
VRIAYVVDVHDAPGAVAEAVGRIGEIDVLLVGGDITTNGTAEDVAAAVESWRPLAATLLGVAGNMDSPAIDARLEDLGVSVNARGVHVGDVGIFGVSAAPFSPLHTPYELADDELSSRAEAGFAAVRGAPVTIFCPHAPPLDTACDRLRDGRHVGSAAIRAFVERAQPSLVLCGHIHESRGEDTIGGSRIVNPGPVGAGHYAVVDVDRSELTVSLDRR